MTRSKNSSHRIVAAGIASVILPVTAVPAQTTVHLDGVIRDFRAAHPDFGVIPLGETGHYAGTVALTLADRPAHVPGGFKVADQWRERNNNPIAPHLYRELDPGLVLLDDAPTLDQDAYIDSWDPILGAYGGMNVGPAPTFVTGAPMPSILTPGSLPPSIGDVLFSGTNTISSNLHTDDFTTEKDAVLYIDGQVTIVVDGLFWMNQLGTIELLPDATLTLYLLDGGAVNQGSRINMNTWDPSRCTIYYRASSTFQINQGCQVCAQIVAPNATVHLNQNDHLYGTLTAESLQLDQDTGLHLAGDLSLDACGVDLVDTPGAASGLGSGGVTDATTFDQWFRDVLSVNQSLVYRIGLRDLGGGVYSFVEPEFHPVDGLLYGNEGQAHNNNFTYDVGGEFRYAECADQYLRVGGGDGLWVFIDDQLVIDLGGADYADGQYVDLDRLGLTDGEVYEFRIFYANRNGTGSAFAIETNMDLISTPPPLNITGSMD